MVTGSSVTTTVTGLAAKKPAPVKPYFYHNIYEKVLAKRLYYFNQVALLLALGVAFSIALTTSGFLSWFLTLILGFPIIWLSFLIIRFAREYCVTVDYADYNSIGSLILGEIPTKKFLVTLSTYYLSSLVHFIILYLHFNDFTYYVVTKTYTERSLINDEVIFFYFFMFYFGAAYSLRHTVWQRNRLNFTYGVSRVEPENVYFKNLPGLLKNAVRFSTLTVLSSPIVYAFFRGFIYRVWLYPVYWPLSLSSEIPRYSVSFGLVFELLVFGGLLAFCWEFSNHLFNVYAQIGCLDGKKPLSSFSNDPINTLLNGLRDVKHPLVRLTAFQELAYLATSDDPQTRAPFYNAHFKSSYIWPAILDECSLVIKENSKRISHRTAISSTLPNINGEEDKIHEFIQPKEEIFGNSVKFEAAKISSELLGSKQPSESQKQKDKENAAPKIGNDFIINTRKSRSEKINESLQKLKKDEITKLHSLEKKYASYTKDVKTFLSKFYEDFLKSKLGFIFRKTIEREAETRCPNPVNFGNAILSISYLLIHSSEEDKIGVVSGTLTDVLVLLETAVSTCGLFTKYPPEYVYDKDNQEHIVSKLHQLAMKSFFDVTVKYNSLLNDLLLPPDVFRLAKWSIDYAISQQKEFDNNHILAELEGDK